jgi:RimJ/RimL family protein N-acetyltransferase
VSDQKLNSPDAALEYGAALLRGDSVCLRATTEQDLTTLARWWSNPDWATLQQATLKPRTPAAIRDMFEAWSRNDSSEGAGFSIENAEGQLVGHATLWGAALPTRIAKYAIMVGPEFAGRGLGTDATRVMLRYAFHELGAHKVELETWAYNSRAERAYEKAGFVREGIRRAAVFHNGEFHDAILMGVISEDWTSTR